MKISECENRIFLVKHFPPLGGIDHGHHVITFNYSYINNIKENEAIKKKLLYNKGDYEKLNYYFDNINWSNEYSNLNANESYNKWLSIYNCGCYMFIPTFKLCSYKARDPLWMNVELKKCVNVNVNCGFNAESSQKLWLLY